MVAAAGRTMSCSAEKVAVVIEAAIEITAAAAVVAELRTEKTPL